MKKRAFTIIELLITIVVSALVINGVIMSLINSMVLNEYNQEFSIAMNVARAQVESIISKKTDWTKLPVPDANGIAVIVDPPLTLANDGIFGRYKVVLTDVNPQLKNVKVSVCWRARGNRVIGDCTCTNAGCTWVSPSGSSPCSIETAIAQR